MPRKESVNAKEIKQAFKVVLPCSMATTNAEKVQCLLEQIMYFCHEKGISYKYAEGMAEEEFGKMTGEDLN